MLDPSRRSAVRRYGLAGLVTLVAFALTWLIRSWIAPGFLPLFFVAVVVSAWYGGWGPALLSLVAALVAFFAVLNPPASTGTPALLSHLGLFVLAALLTIWLVVSARRAERTLRQERDFSSAILDTTDSLVVVLDRHGRIVQFNKACEQITGYSAGEVRGKPVWDLFLPHGDAKKVKALFSGSPAGHFPAEQVQAWIARDGGRRLIAWSNRILVSGAGSLEYVIATGRDMTGREQAETEHARLVREQEARAEAEDVANRMRRLQVVTDTALAHLSLGELLHGLLDRIREMLSVETAAVFLFDPESHSLVVHTASGLEGETGDSIRLPIDRGVAGRIAAEHRAIIAADVGPSDIFSPILREKGVRSLLGVPLTVEGQLIGMIRVGSVQPYHFSEEDAHFLQLIADRVAVAIDRARLYEAERTARAVAEAAQYRLAFLAKVGELLAASLDYESSLQAVARLAVPAIADLCLVDLVGEDLSLRELVVVSADPAHEARWHRAGAATPRPLDRSDPLWKLLASGEPVLCSKPPDSLLAALAGDADRFQVLQSLGIRSLMVVPLRAHGEILGTICLASVESGRDYGPGDLSLAEELAHRATLAVDNGRLYQRAQWQMAQLRALHEATLTLTSDLKLESVLQRIVDLSRALTGARYGALGVIGEDGKLQQFVTSGIDPHTRTAIGHLPRGRGLLGYLMHKGQPIRVDDIQAHPESAGFPANHPPMKRLLGVPLFYKGQLLGDLYLTDKASGLPFDESDEELVVLFGAQAAAALANARLAQRIEGLAVVEERQRFAMDLHDGIIQSIYAIGLTLQSTALRVGAEQQEVAEQLQATIQGLNEVIQDIRGYIANLGPGRFGGRALSAGLVDLAREIHMHGNTQVGIEVEDGVDECLGSAQKTELFHIAREALTNVVKHARATAVEIRVELDDDLENTMILIRDNGEGFSLPAGGFPEHHRGLRNISRRVAAMGGRLEVRSTPGQGTSLHIVVPVLVEVPAAG